MLERFEESKSYVNPYMGQMLGEYRQWCFTEEEALNNKGAWGQNIFESEQAPLDLEIGTGNGFFFAHYASQNPSRRLIGLELKYKPLVQSIRRALASGARNMKIGRAHAERIDEYFGPEEIQRIFLHFPDPWPKRRHHKNRLITRAFLGAAHEVLAPGGFLEFKTDNLEYFNWALKRLEKTPFRVTNITNDLHESDIPVEDFRTHFEKLWTRKGRKTNYLLALKD